jgi:signal transduction histidine kinase/CheY-like chemotaxis protein/HPt (histidine-containing phosphotransfer) domain-containing protein
VAGGAFCFHGVRKGEKFMHVRVGHIRIRVILVIVITNLIIVLFSILAGAIFLRNGIEESQEANITEIANIADQLLSLEIDMLKLKADIVVNELTNTDASRWPTVFDELKERDLKYIIGMTVFKGPDIIASAGEMPAGSDLYENSYFQQAFSGEATLTSTCLTDNGAMFYLAVPLPGTRDCVVAFTIHGTHFSMFVSDIVIWKTGHIFILDSNGYMLANVRPQWIQERHNFLKLAEIESGYDDVASVMSRMTHGYSGVGRYAIAGRQRICAYRAITGSREGWSLGVVAPLVESSFRNIDRGLIIVGLVSFLLSAIAAIIASGVIKRPFEESVQLREIADANSKAKSEFLANMSHEIRTPMNEIIGMTELLEHERLTDHQRRYVSDINMASHSLLDIINDILDMSKIESGKLILNPVTYVFKGFMDNIASMFKYVAKNKGLKFEYEIIGKLPEYLYGDDIRLRQVLTNICGNAVKFTEEGHIKLIVYTKGNMLAFKIEDTGAGIRKEDLQNIFNAYEQVDRQKSRKITGTGLGLSISKSFVEMMGGEITVESEYGQGSAFTVMFPIVEGKEEDVKYVRDNESEQKWVAPTADILVVDDNDFNLKVACGMLGLLEIDAKTASSGKEALELVKHNDYDIVFMDHMMPEMDGIETTEKIRKLGGKYESLPIIALTANAVQGAREMFLANGLNDFISKPIDANTLREILVKWLPRRKIELCQEADIAGSEGEEPANNFLELLGKIGEINAKLGLSRVSNSEDMYRDILKLFYKSILPECEKMSVFLRDKNTQGFSISVHAMKSVLSTIGALKLSQTALDLETASKNNELDYCLEMFPDFAEKLLALHKQLAIVFPCGNSISAKKAGDIDYLRENVQKAIAAADDFDSDAGLEAIQNLLEYDFGEENNALIENAVQAFKEFDCASAAEKLKGINLPTNDRASTQD